MTEDEAKQAWTEAVLLARVVLRSIGQAADAAVVVALAERVIAVEEWHERAEEEEGGPL